MVRRRGVPGSAPSMLCNRLHSVSSPTERNRWVALSSHLSLAAACCMKPSISRRASSLRGTWRRLALGLISSENQVISTNAAVPEVSPLSRNWSQSLPGRLAMTSEFSRASPKENANPTINDFLWSSPSCPTVRIPSTI